MKQVDFSFITDSRIKAIVERDFAELQKLDPSQTPKAVLILAGGIIEGLLSDALVKCGHWDLDRASRSYLNDMIGPAVGLKIITEDRLTQAVRKYRNVVHVWREINESMIFEESDATLARSAVVVITREVRDWHSKRTTAP